MAADNTPPIINYDDTGASTYRTDFWEGKGRDYEDRVERIALERLLQPPTGKRLLELGAGFGRLSSFFSGYDEVILLDYSKSQLAYARQQLGDQKYRYVAANIYQLPIADGACDAATMIRVLHHFVDAPAALAEVRRALSPGAVFVLEYANKRNLKAMMRYALRRQQWSPYSTEPVEFVKLNFDFHPAYIQEIMEGLDFEVQRRLAVSFFRLGILKRWIPAGLLVNADKLLQPSGLLYAPSIFTQNEVPGTRPTELPTQIFRCPTCKESRFQEAPEELICKQCGSVWSTAEGIYDFREALRVEA